MPTVYAYSHGFVTIGNHKYEYGDRSAPAEISVGNGKIDETFDLSAGETRDVFGVASEHPFTAFGFLAIESNYDVEVEITVDKGNEVGTKIIVLPVVAGVPFVLADNYSLANYSADWAGGTDDVIDRIRVHNDSGASNTARVNVLMLESA